VTLEKCVCVITCAGYVIRASGRWAHTMPYLNATARAAGLEVLKTLEGVTLRVEWLVPEKGHLIICRRKSDVQDVGKSPSDARAADNTRLADVCATADGCEKGGGGCTGLARAVALDPGNASLRNDFGVALGHENRWPQAVEQLETSLALWEEQLQHLQREAERVRQNLDKARKEMEEAESHAVS
jgi:hypothetical protein